MAFKALNPSATRRLTCPYDKREPQSVFIVSESLPASVRAMVKDKYSEYSRGEEDDTTTMRFAYGQRNIAIVQHGLKGLEGFKNFDDSDVVVKLTKDAVIDDVTLEALNIPIQKDGYDTLIDWLANKIWEANTVTDAETKNLP